MESVEERGSNARKKSTGRPKKANKKDKFLMVRLTSPEYLIIKIKAEKAGLKPSEWFRKAARHATVTPRFSPEEIGYMRTFSGLANNLNQLTKLAHSQGLLSLAVTLRRLLDQIGPLIEKLSGHDR